MGKTRRTGDLVTDNNLYVNPTTDSFHIGTGCTIYGGSVGIVSAISYYGNGSNITGISTLNIVNYSAGGGGGSSALTTLAFLNS